MTRVLVVGDMRIGTNSRSVRDGYCAAGCDVREISTEVIATARKGSALWRSIRSHGQVTTSVDDRIRSSIRDAEYGWKPDVLLAIKTVHLDQETLLQSSAAVKVHQSFDDVSNPDNITARYLESEAEWDFIVTTKRHNMQELRGRGVQHPIFLWGAYDPRYRQRVLDLSARRFDLGFIGASRPDRADLPETMARTFRGRCVIYGPRWRRQYPFGVGGLELRGPATGEAFTAAANSFRMGLVLLNSDNRDQHTNRSFEAPACGQMVIAKRTLEHEEMFDESAGEAILFDSLDQAWELADWYSRRPDDLVRIAEAGFQRIATGNNTYRDRADSILRSLGARQC